MPPLLTWGVTNEVKSTEKVNGNGTTPLLLYPHCLSADGYPIIYVLRKHYAEAVEGNILS